MEMLSAVVLCLLAVNVVGLQPGGQNDENTVWSCGNVSHTSLVLQCPNHTDWFHVSEETSSVGNCTTGETLGTVRLKNDGYTQLSVNCVGRQNNTSGQCEEAVDFSQGDSDNTKNNLLKVKYECIKDVLNYNICEDITNLKIPTGVVYLASSNFLRNTSSSTESRLCQCRVSNPARALALYVAVGSRLNVSCENCNIAGSFRNGHDDTLINEAVVISNSSSVILFLSFNQSAASTVSENSAWIRIAGDGQIELQCNGGLETLTSTTDISTTTLSSFTTTFNNSTTSATDKPGIYLYIIGAVAGVFFISTLIIVAVVVFCNMRRKQQLKKNRAKVTYGSTNPDLTHDADGYCVIDTNQKRGDITTSPSESKKTKWFKWKQTKVANGATDQHTHLNNSTQDAGKDGLTPLCMQSPVLSTAPVAASTKRLTNQGFSNDREERKVYHFLDPDPDVPQEKDIVFVCARHGVIQQSGNFSCDPNPREHSVHLYSDVEDIDGTSGGEANPVQSLQNPTPQIPRRNQGKEYEDVEASDLQSPQHSEARIPPRDPSSEYQEVVAGSVQLSYNSESRIPSKDKSNGYKVIKAVGEPSKVDHILQPDPNAPPESDVVIVPLNPLAHAVTGAVNSTGDRLHKGVEDAPGKDLEDDDDELVMIDNIVYNSGDPKPETKHQSKVNGAVNSSGDCMHKGDAQASGRDLDDDDDELVMINNIVYNSSDPKSQTQHQHKVAGDCTHKRVEEASGDDDELVMIENILYNSSDPKPQTQHRDSALDPQPPTSTDPTRSEEAIPSDYNLHHYSEVDESLIISSDNPDTPLQTGHSLNGESGTGESGYHHYMDIDDSAIASAGDSKTRPANNGGKTPTTRQYEEIVLTP